MNITRKSKFLTNTFGAIAILIVLTFVFIYLFHPACRNNFGIEFNHRRRALQIPIIPPTWKIKQNNFNFNMKWWMGKELIIGHEGKRVIFSGCEIDEEIDDYFFSLQQIQERTLQIRYKYINSTRKKDSIIFIYQVGNKAKPITKKQADSVFNVYNIKKDY